MKNRTVLLTLVTVILVFLPCISAQGWGGRDRGRGDREEGRHNEAEMLRKFAEKRGIPIEEAKERLEKRRAKGREEEVKNRGKQMPQFGKQEDTSMAVTTTDKYLFIIKGNYIYKFNIETLDLIKKAVIDPDKEKRGEHIRNFLKKQIENKKAQIEKLEAEGKFEEAEKVEAELREIIKKAKKLQKGGQQRAGNRKNRERPRQEEVNREDEVLF